MSKKRIHNKISTQHSEVDANCNEIEDGLPTNDDIDMEESGSVEHHILRLLQHQQQQSAKNNRNKQEEFDLASIVSSLCSTNDNDDKDLLKQRRNDCTYLKDTYLFLTQYLVRLSVVRRKEGENSASSSWFTEKDIADMAIPHLMRSIMSTSTVQSSSGKKKKSKKSNKKASSEEDGNSATVEEAGLSKEKEHCRNLQWKFLAVCLEIVLLGRANGDGIGDDTSPTIDGNAVMTQIQETIHDTLYDKHHSKASNDDDSTHFSVKQSNKKRKFNRVAKSQASSLLTSTLNTTAWNKFLLEAIHSVFATYIASPTTKKTAHGNNDDKMEVDSEDRGEDMKSTIAWPAKCYMLIMMYGDVLRPNMDYLCNTLLVELTKYASSNRQTNVSKDSNASEATPSSTADLIASNLLQVTLFALWHHHLDEGIGRVSNTASPKKSFLWLSSPTTIWCLSRINAIMACDESKDDGNADETKDSESCHFITELISNILRQGLFHPEHHLDGFCTMNLKMPNIADIKAYLDDIDKDDDTPSTKSKRISSNGSYQKELLQTLTTLLSGESNEALPNVTSSDGDVSYVATLLPTILKILMKSIQENENLSTSLIAKIQFRFWSCATYPIVHHLHNHLKDSEARKEVSTLLQSFKRCATVLTEYESYLPSHDDPQGLHLEYLQIIGEIMLRLVNLNLLHDTDQQQLLDGMGIMKDLFNLNHHIYHHKLDQFIIILSRVFSIRALYQHTLKDIIVSQLCLTYQKLRQLPHLVEVILKSISTDGKKGEENQSSIKQEEIVKKISFLTNDSSFERSFSIAIRSLPSGQIKELWNMFKTHIADTKNASNRHDKMNLIVDTFVLFIKAINVNEFNAMEIATLCQESMESSIPLLIEFIEEEESVRFDMKKVDTQCGLYLCGWIVDLHTKCCFWLNDIVPQKSLLNHSKDGNEAKIISALQRTIVEMRSSISSTLERWSDKDDKKSRQLGILQHLCCHRIQQLHAMIYQQEELEGLSTMAGDDTLIQEDSNSSDLVQEAKTLVEFVVFATLHRSYDIPSHESNETTLVSIQSYSSEWGRLAKLLSMWVPYSEPDHIKEFLKWLFFTHSIKMQSKPIGRKEAFERIDAMPACCESYISVFELESEKRIASALLHDASFMEQRLIANHYVSIGLACAVEWIKSSFCHDEQTTFYKSCLVTPFDAQYVPLSMDLYDSLSVTILRRDKDYKGKKVLRRPEHLKSAARIMTVLNQIHIECIGQDDVETLLDISIRLHVMTTRYATICDIAEMAILHEVVEASRTTICQALAFMARTNGAMKCDDSEEPTFVYSFMEHLIASTIGMVSRTPESTKENEWILKSFGRVLGHLLSYCLVSSDQKFFIEGGNNDDESIDSLESHKSDIHRFVSLLKRFIRKEVNAVKHMSMVLRPIIQQIIYFMENDREQESTSQGVYKEYFNDLCSILQRFMIRLVDEEVERNIDQDKAEDSILLFLTDYLRLESILNPKSTLMNSFSAIEPLFQFLKEKLRGSEVGKVDSLIYLLCLVSTYSHTVSTEATVQAKFAEELQMILVHRCIETNGSVEALLESSYCEMIRQSSEEQFQSLLLKLVGFRQDGIETAFGAKFVCAPIYCFHLMLLASSNERIATVTDSFRVFIDLALNVHYPRPRDVVDSVIWTRNILVAQSFLCTVVGRKDIIVLPGSDIPRILAALSSIIPTPLDMKERRHAENLRDVKNCKLNISSVVLLLATVKNYNRQLYGCAPPFISVFRSFLKYVMLPRELTLETSTERLRLLREFTTLCQSLINHKEVFKKHVVTLILDYTNELRKGMDSSTKDELMPAISYLLDTLSKYEIQQLNALMDTTSKTLFQNIYQTYKKRLYTGNF